MTVRSLASDSPIRPPNFIAAAALLLISGGAVAATPEAYPQKPVRLIVPIAPGSVTDVIARAASRDLAPRLGQTLVVDNRAGATGIIGAELCARGFPEHEEEHEAHELEGVCVFREEAEREPQAGEQPRLERSAS